MNALVTKSFEQQCLAFPSKVERLLATIDTLDGATDLLSQASAMQHYSKQLKAGVGIERPIALGVLKIKAKIGELCPAKSPKEAGSLKGKKGSKEDLPPFDKMTIAAYRKLAKNKEKLEEYYESVDDVPTQSGFIEYAKDPHVSNNSVENEWYTPSVYIEAAREAMLGIDLDPASSELAQETVKAGAYYTIDDDGLSKPWFGNLWMNPPYSKELIGRFTERLRVAYEDGQIPQAIVLVNNATETGWFQKLASVCSAFCFCSGRIKFNDKNGKPANSPLQGQCFMYLGDSPERFCETFQGFGIVCRK